MYEENNLDSKFNYKEWKKILGFVRPYRKLIIYLFISSIMLAFAIALYPMIARYALNNFIIVQTTDGLGYFIAFIIVVVLAQALFDIIWGAVAMRIDLGVGKDMRHTLFKHTQTLSIEYFNKTPVGFILARINHDTHSMGGMFSWMLGSAIDHVFYIVFALVNMFILSTTLAWIMLVIIIVLVIVTGYYQKRLIGLNRLTRSQNSLITAAYNENINGVQTIKSIGCEKLIKDYFDSVNNTMRSKTMAVDKVKRSFIFIVALLGGAGIALIIYASVPLVYQNLLDIGTLSAFISYSFAIIPRVEDLTYMINNTISLQANVERINSLMDSAPTVFDQQDIIDKYGDIYNPKYENWEPIKGDIEFCDVSFKYPQSDTYVLKNFSLKIPAGTSIAIVGQTGAGKSTLVNLICRFYEPTSGTILIDGIDYKKRSLLWLEDNLSYVLQSPHLFSGTIKENIKYKNPLASDEDMYTASKLAQAHNFIEKLDKGYETDVGQDGGKLSTGQKQLISIARALMANGKILILDEATSSVDTKTEQLINSITSEIKQDKTSFIIAHRLASVKSADIIIVVDSGNIVEMGNHKQLLSKHGLYYNMYTSQRFDDEQDKFFKEKNTL